jgi:hypothetical protein
MQATDFYVFFPAFISSIPSPAPSSGFAMLFDYPSTDLVEGEDAFLNF